MKLLCMKSERGYLKVIDENFELVPMDKASVYPVEQVEKVKALVDGYGTTAKGIHIVVLTITQEVFVS